MISGQPIYLQGLVRRQARFYPEGEAVRGPDGSLTYRELDQLANQFAHALSLLGVQPGDRVGIWLDKSAMAVAAMQGILRTGAIYVPLDPLSPRTRIVTIIQDCAIHLLITTRVYMDHLAEVASKLSCLVVDAPIAALQGQRLSDFATDEMYFEPVNDQEIAYILYTSGSTGVPKGVCISHRNALAFVNWASDKLQVNKQDRLANHAPFHFDLSVFDLYAAFSCGATVVLIPENQTYVPMALVEFLRRERITIWYSVPSVLILMMEQGELLERDAADLRCILFAGEPFPIKHLRVLYETWSTIRYLNLYGPTETNVCTYYELTMLAEEWNKPIPIGRACSGDRVWAQKEDGTIAQSGEEGELVVEGPTVMVGYWGQAQQQNLPYATGDIVRQQEDGDYLYIGRKDHMVKVRGYRVEPGDIEAALAIHPAIHEVAVLVVGTGIEARITGFIVCAEGEYPSLLELKRHCAQHIPRYMIIDNVRELAVLPRTRNGKVDRLTLATLALEPRG